MVSFYPPSLWQSPTAPLHFLVTLRKSYVSSSGDPFFSGPSQHQPWFAAFLWIELFVQFPLAAFLVFRLARGSAMTGAGELAGLAFGCLTFMGSAACCAELWHMGENVVSAEKWGKLFYGTYLPFVIIRKCYVLRALPCFLRLRDSLHHSC